LYIIKYPILLYHGSGDKLTSHEATQKFAESIEEQSNVVFKLWEDGYHELHNDIVRDEVYAYLNAWIDEQLIKAKQQKEIERKEGLT
jgi:acylglycerol lipase